MPSKSLSPKKPPARAPRVATTSAASASPAKPAATRRTGQRTKPGVGTAPAGPEVYLPLANGSRTARSHRVLAPTLKPTRVSEEQIAEAVRNFRRA